MKHIVYIIIALLVFKSYAQSKDSFVFESMTVDFEQHYTNDGFTNKFYVVINYRESIKKCLPAKNTRYYFINIPGAIPKDKHEKFFMEFVHYITGRVKLMDSEFYVIADNNYTGLYNQSIREKARYKGSRMNPIKREYVSASEAEICRMLYN